MISCKECSTLNSLDSAFCKNCGKPLPAEEALDAREHLEKKLDEAFELFHHGRTDEAALMADTALSSDPTSLRAMSLKAMVLERRGLVQEALEVYEGIVAKDPNAALERMKVQTLRGVLQAKYLTPPAVDKRVRALVAASAAIFVISAAGIAALMMSRPTAQVVAKSDPTAGVTMDTFAPEKTEPSSGQAGQSQSDQKPATSESDPAATNRATEAKLPDDVPANALLPKPSASDDPADVKPLNPLATGAEIRQLPNQTAPNNTRTDPSSAPKSDPEPSEVPVKTEPQTGPPPLVDIQLSDQNQASGSDGGIDANGVEALVRTARGQYQVGNYQAAATTYEKALKAGADAAMVNQRLGQCYDKLGRTSDATAAYNRAIAAIQNAINQGRGNKQLLLAALESSRQALQNLQGG